MNKEVFRSIKFVLFSASAGIIQALSLVLFQEVLGIIPWVSYLVALILSVIWNFTLNRKYTFHSDGQIARAMLLVAAYYLVFTPLTTWDVHFFTEVLGWEKYIVEGLNMLLNLVTEFLFQRYVVYGKRVDNAIKAK